MTAPEMHAAIRADLIAHSEPWKLPVMQRFFKDPIDAYCTYTAHVRNIAKLHGTEFESWSLRERMALTDTLWASGKFEEGSVAIQLYARMRRHCDDRDWKQLTGWLAKFIRNWAHCDALCSDVLGPLLIKHPERIGELHGWAEASQIYKRRAALVAPLKGLRKGLFRTELEALAAQLTEDREDIVKKGIVWVRRELAR